MALPNRLSLHQKTETKKIIKKAPPHQIGRPRLKKFPFCSSKEEKISINIYQNQTKSFTLLLVLSFITTKSFFNHQNKQQNENKQKNTKKEKNNQLRGANCGIKKCFFKQQKTDNLPL